MIKGGEVESSLCGFWIIKVLSLCSNEHSKQTLLLPCFVHGTCKCPCKF